MYVLLYCTLIKEAMCYITTLTKVAFKGLTFCVYIIKENDVLGSTTTKERHQLPINLLTTPHNKCSS
jgi:hypothetical protein